MMTPEQCTPGTYIWYQPSPGIRFLACVLQPPRLLGSEWVVAIAFTTTHYARWRDVPNLTGIPAAALTHLYPDNP